MQSVSEILSLCELLLPGGERQLMGVCAAEAEGEILNYCGLESLPEELYPLAARWAVSLYNGGTSGNVKSLSRGDYSVTYGESLTEELKRALQPYRKVRW